MDSVSSEPLISMTVIAIFLGGIILVGIAVGVVLLLMRKNNRGNKDIIE